MNFTVRFYKYAAPTALIPGAGGTRGATRNYFTFSTGEIRRRKLLVHHDVFVSFGSGAV